MVVVVAVAVAVANVVVSDFVDSEDCAIRR